MNIFQIPDQKHLLRPQFRFVSEEFLLHRPQFRPVRHVVWQLVRCNEIQKNPQHRQLTLPILSSFGWLAGLNWVQLSNAE